MAFTLAQVENAFAINNDVVSFHIDITEVRKTVNYEVIIDYLTGKTNSLAGLQQDNNNYLWIQLVNLLKDFEKPSANDHLILDIIRHPDMIHIMDNVFSVWLINYALTHTSENSLQAVINQFRANGMTDDEIFGFFILHIGFGAHEDLNIEGTALKKYLADHIKRAKQLVYPRAGYLQWNDAWSMFYFRLVEEARPEFATEYVLYGIYSERTCPVVFFDNYRKGHYLPVILDFLQ